MQYRRVGKWGLKLPETSLARSRTISAVRSGPGRKRFGAFHLR